jgi:hypothetical protein
MKRLLAVALFLAFTGLAHGEEPALPQGTEPIAPELLKGRTLVLENGNCSVEAPHGFEWLASPGMTEKHPEVHMFLCRDPEQSRIFMLQVYDKGFSVLDAKGMDDFLSGARGSMEQQDWKFLETQKKEAAIPLPESSYHFSVKLLRGKDHQEIFWVGYVATAQKMYCLSAMQLEAGDRPEFNQFVRSFKLLHAPPSPGVVLPLIPYALLSMSVGFFVVFLARRRQKAAESDAEKELEEILASEGDVEDDDDETDAFKPKPIVPAKPKVKAREKARAAKPVEEPPAKPAKEPRRDRERTRPDEDSRGRKRPEGRARDEESDRKRKNDRPFG